MAEALTTIGDLATKALGIITGNKVLMTIFCGGLMGIGFKIISQQNVRQNNLTKAAGQLIGCSVVFM